MLLAKSDPPLSLKDHADDVVRAAQRLRAIWPFLPPVLERAALFHDFGKAADGFQAMLQPDGPRWGFRHEILSAEIFRNLHDLSDPQVLAAYLALLTHHKNLGEEGRVSKAFRECASKTPYSLWFDKWRELRADELKQDFAAVLHGWTPNPQAPSPANCVSTHLSEMQPVFSDLQTALMRGALVAADHLASAGLDVAVEGRNITREALENYARKRVRGWKRWKPLQLSAAKTNGSATLVAPTGAGKTEAALLWALNNRAGAERIFYLLPYQVSINVMAARIAEAFPDEAGNTLLHKSQNVSLLHANINLTYLQDALTGDLSRRQAIAIAKAKEEAARKIYAPIKITTVYQLLNIFFGRKFFEVGLLELSNALVIFDEIHAYDGHTLGLILVLLKYLQRLGARIFIMTATLPKALKDQLNEAAGITQEIVLSEDDALQTEVRRRVELLPHKIESRQTLTQIRAAVESGKRTIIVCNTVNKAISLWQDLREYQPLLVHSRFTIGHRARRETKSNIEAQRLVISTQIIEVSLDVSFDVMFTELAPADSLLQRFGRVNRHTEDPKEDDAASCYIACGEDVGSRKIYDPDLLSASENGIRQLIEKYKTTSLEFRKACEWMETVYPSGLTEFELRQMNMARARFEGHVAQLKPMIDPAVDEDLELTLFQSLQVIPSKYERRFMALKEGGRHLSAKRLLVNVDLRAWAGASQYAQREGFNALRKYLHKNQEFWVALFDYRCDEGLRLDQPCDQSHSNVC